MHFNNTIFDKLICLSSISNKHCFLHSVKKKNCDYCMHKKCHGRIEHYIRNLFNGANLPEHWKFPRFELDLAKDNIPTFIPEKVTLKLLTTVPLL